MSGTGGPGWDHDRQEPGDQIQFGAVRRRPWLGSLALAAAIITAVIIIAVRSGHGAPGHHRAARPDVVVRYTGHPILGETAGWELFARGDSFVADIQPGSGRITRTAVPPLASGNPAVSFFVGPHEVIVRSYDYVPGYLVPDGQPARQLTGTLATGGPLVPGPAPGEAWTQAGNGQNLTLVTLSGHRIGPSVPEPPTGRVLLATAIPDGRGYLLAWTVNNGGLVDLGPGWDRPVHAGIVAIGPTGWFGQRCVSSHRCRNVVIDPATGAERPLPGPAPAGQFRYWSWAPGAISPDGTRAAVLYGQRLGGALRVVLVDLITGARTPVAVQLPGAPILGSMAWSPDCQWLFVASKGKLLAVSAASGQITTLHLGLPPVSQVAVRVAAP